MQILKKIKYTLLKLIDLSGLTFLAPIVRLCYGEEPTVQLQKIGQWILIPLCAILLFVFAWYSVAKNVHTKAGQLPDPSQTYQAYKSVNIFAQQMASRNDAYLTPLDKRQPRIDAANARLEAIKGEIEKADKAVTETKEEAAKELAASLKTLKDAYEKRKDEGKQFKKEKEAYFIAKAAELTKGNNDQYNAYLTEVAEVEQKIKDEKEALSEMDRKISTIEDRKNPKVAKALATQTALAEEEQALKKDLEYLEKRNKAVTLAEYEAKMKEDKAGLLTLTGEEAYTKARSIVKLKEKIKKTEESEKLANGKTFWYQVKRSVFCVFVGFIIGTAIAVPVGILCGLNSTFMAAMTPFIAIFKPVSPIVWLPICLIVVSAQFPDPENHPVMEYLWDLPGIWGEFQINPAFIASATTVALCSLWATLANTALGVASIDKDHLNVARVLKLGFFARLFKIVIPSALPLIFAGLRISLGVGWMVLIAAELLSSSEGIGKFVWDQFNNGASDSLAKMVFVVFVVGFIGLILDRIMIIFQRLVSFEGSAAAI